MLWVFVPFFFLWASWPLLKRVDPYVGDTFYRIKRNYQRSGDQKNKLWKFITGYTETLFPFPDFLKKLDDILEMAGRPGKLRAIDVLFLQLGLLIGILALSLWAKKTSPKVLLVFGILVSTLPWQNWLKRIKLRRLEASESIRMLKRRFSMLLKMKTSLDDALKNIADLAPGTFGESFRARLSETARPLSDRLRDLQREFRVRELTHFVQAVCVADSKTGRNLGDLIDKQIRDETARMDEFVDKQKATVQLKMRGFAVLAFLYVIAFVGYFGWQVIKLYMKQGHGFLGL